MKYKLFVFCIILFSLNNIIFGNLGIEYLNYLEQEQTINIDIKKTKIEKSNLFMTITNDTLISTAKININPDLDHDLIEINVTCSNKTDFNLIFYNDSEIVKPKKKTNEQYIFVLKSRDLPKNNKLYIKISIDETGTKEEDIDFESKDYHFLIEYQLNDYDFIHINDDDEKRYSVNKEISYVQNNELLYNEKKIVITFLGSGIDSFKVEYAFDESDKYEPLEKNFFNGYGLIIDNTILTINEERIKFKITITAEYEMVHIETRIYSSGPITINKYDSFDIIIYKNKPDTKSQCFKLADSVIDASKKYTLNYISYTKNIVAKYSNNKNIPINQESMFEEINGFNSVCFELSDSNQKDFGTLSLELMDISIKELPKKDYNEYRVIRALPTNHYLSSSASFVFKPEVFLKNETNVLNIHFKMIEGVSQLSIGKFKNSEFNIEKEYTDFNGFIFVRESLSNYNDKTFAMVECTDENKNCKYIIEIKEESENSYFYPDLRWYNFISKNNIGNFMINVKDKQNNDLLLNINSFSYNPTVVINIGGKDVKTLSNKDNDNFLLNNKISYIIKKDDFANQEYIYIKVKNNDNSAHILYGINYQISDGKIPIESGILYSYQISKNFVFNPKYKNCEGDSIININTFSNVLSINGHNPENNLIQISPINEFSLSNDIIQGDKIVNFEVHENSVNSRIFIEIGHLYRNKLTQKGEITYSYLFKKSTGNKFVLNFRKFSNVPAKIIYNDNEITINKLSKSIIIEENDIKCFNEFQTSYKVCIFDIKIQVDDANDSLDFSIQMLKFGDKESTHIYLPQNTFMSGILIPSKKTIYYSEIKETSTGKIFVDFLGGEGKVDAQIKNKKDGNINTLTYNNKYFDIQEKGLSQCNEGCYIYINLNLDEAKSNYEYNIYFKAETSSELNLNVPEGEYVYGYLDTNKVDYYRTKIVRKTSLVSFFVDCEDCNLVVKNANNEEIGSFYCMKKDQFNINISGPEEIKYSIENKGTSNKKYNIKVVSYSNGGPLIVPINSIRNELCSIKSDTPCYFYVSMEEYNKINYLKFLVHNANNANISFADCTEKNIYDDSIIQFIKDNNNYKISPKNNYLSIENKIKELIIRIQLDYTENITFVSSIYELVSEPISNNMYQEEFYIIDLDQTKTISPLEKGLIDYEMYLIEGKGYIMEKSKNKKYMLEAGFQESIHIIASKDSSNIELSLYDFKTNFVLYYRVKANKNSLNNLAELNFQKSNYFKFLNDINDNSFLPLNFFVKLNITNSQKDNLNDIHLNYKFSNEYNESQNIPEESFDITIYLVNQKYIFNNQNEDPKPEEKLNLDKTDYIYEFTSGYVLIEAEKIKEKLKNIEDIYYLLIKIDTKNKNLYSDINLALTLFDLTNNYVLPMNEYLYMLINQATKINIGRNLGKEYTPFTELVTQNLDFNFDDKDVSTYFKYGKNISSLSENKAYKLTINKILDNKVEKPNLITKYAICDKENHSYFSLYSEDIKGYNNETEKVTFYPITVTNEDPTESSYFIYNIRLYDRLNNINFSPKNLLEDKLPETKAKYLSKTNEPITYKIDFGGKEYGLFYISILAEARKGNVHEYFLYNAYKISKIIDDLTIDINITTTKQYNITGFARNIIFKGKIAGDGDFIKLYVSHKEPLEENLIYASQDESFQKSTNLYKDSKYKTIDRETALIIPMDEIDKNIPLYIRIPCNGICDYDFYYVIYSKDNIEMDDNQCFDIDLKSENNKYNFTYSTEEKNINSLITITGYSLKGFNVIADNVNKNYFNGYSSLINHNGAKKKFNFVVNDKLRVKVCHRFLKEAKDIIDGDKIYSALNDINKGECFNINNKNEEIKYYSLTFISKTKNLEAEFYENNKVTKKEEINEESKNIILDPTFNKFCLSRKNGDAGVFFQLLSVKDNQENQKVNLPLIKGVSILQRIPKGQSIYYRIIEYTPDSKSINIHFQSITGNTDINFSQCTGFPKCNFTDNQNLNKYMINNNIYFNYDLPTDKLDNIYHKSEFPVIIVNCTDTKNDCNYYLEMSNEKDTKLLNQENKIYSFVQDGSQNYTINTIANKKPIYLQVHTLTGKVNAPIASKGKFEYFEYYNNTQFLIFNEVSDEITISVNGEKNSYYNIYYYYLEEKNNYFYLPKGEVQYNIIPKDHTYYYYFNHKLKQNNESQYIVSINAINCYLTSNDNENEGKRNIQFKVENNETKWVKWYANGLNTDDKCEFTISSAEIYNSSTKELIINDGIYNYFELDNGNSVILNYLFSKNDLNKTILINVNKKSEEVLNIEYKFRNGQKTNKKIKKYGDLFEINYNNNDNNKEGLDNIESFEILEVKINQTSTNKINFRININGRKNLPVYLDPEEIEYGIVKKNEDRFYYFDYYYSKNSEEKQQIFLNSKGIARIKSIKLFIKKTPNKNPDDISNKAGINSADNYFILRNQLNDCSNGCRIYFSIFIEGNEVNNPQNLFTVYRQYAEKKLYVPENTNIYGYMDNIYTNKKHSFMTKIKYYKNNYMKISLHCQTCVMDITISGTKYAIKNSLALKFSTPGEETLEYSISKANNEYYYFSLSNNNTEKYIEQLEPEKCFFSYCNFLLPLHEYYKYNQQKIILFVPDNEEAQINLNLLNMDEYENKLEDNNNNKYKFSSKEQPITNWYILDLSDYYKQNKYLHINIDSKRNSTLIISQFYNSLNAEKINYGEYIYTINNEKSHSFNAGTYKFDLLFIDGKGSSLFKINNEEDDEDNENEENYLGYESQEALSFIKKIDSPFNFVTKSLSDINFTYYLKVTNGELSSEKIDELKIQRNNHLKYDNIDGEIFPIKYKFLVKDNHNLVINFRFMKLEKENEVYGEVFDCDKESFLVSANAPIKDYFYSNSLRRGYIFIKAEDMSNHIYTELTISKNKTNAFNYKSVFVEITPLYISSNNKDIKIPRNTYLQLELNKETTYELSFIKPRGNNDTIKIDLANDTDISKISIKKNDITEEFKTDINGKKNYSFEVKDCELKGCKMDISLEEKGKILIKNILENNYTYKFEVINNEVNINNISKNKDENIHEITHENIRFSEKNINTTEPPNYKITYLIRLFNILDYIDQDEIDNILFPKNLSIKSFRKEIPEKELVNETVKYNVPFGKIEKGQYYINIIGEVSFNGTIEYFEFFNIGHDLRVVDPPDIKFDDTWVYVLIALIIIMLLLIAYIVRFFIKNKNEGTINEIIDDKKQFLMNKANN